MFRHVKEPQFNARVSRPDPKFARPLLGHEKASTPAAIRGAEIRGAGPAENMQWSDFQNESSRS